MTAGFSVAAFRFGHTLIQEWFRRFNQKSFQHKDKSEFRPIPVLDFENPQYLYEICQGGVDAILRGLIKDAAGKADGLVNKHFFSFLNVSTREINKILFFSRPISEYWRQEWAIAPRNIEINCSWLIIPGVELKAWLNSVVPNNVFGANGRYYELIIK